MDTLYHKDIGYVCMSEPLFPPVGHSDYSFRLTETFYFRSAPEAILSH
jgi:hypothetical protein